MQYEVNIAKQNGTRFYDGARHPAYLHWAKVTLSQSDTVETAKEKARQISAAFPSPEYKISLTCWRSSGVAVGFEPDIAAELSTMAETLKPMEPDAGHPANRA